MTRNQDGLHLHAPDYDLEIMILPLAAYIGSMRIFGLFGVS